MGENPENVDIVHQDDDGFESLNGNVSSDNDRGIVRPELRDDGKKTIETGTSASFDEGRNCPPDSEDTEIKNDQRPAGSLHKKFNNLSGMSIVVENRNFPEESLRLHSKYTCLVIFVLDIEKLKISRVSPTNEYYFQLASSSRCLEEN